MKLDTSSYYPESPLGPDPHITEEATVPVPQKPADTPTPPSPRASEGSPAPDEPPSFLSKCATGISWLMVPLMMPIYGILLVFGLTILHFVDSAAIWTFSSLIALITVVVPAFLVILLKRMGIINDVGLNNQKERLIPYIISIFCFAGAGWFLWVKGFPLWVAMFYIGGALTGMIELVINFWWKISAHAAGVAGLVALMITICHEAYPGAPALTWLIVTILLAGLTGSARLLLRRHTLWQVMAGYAVGFCSIYFLTSLTA